MQDKQEKFQDASSAAALLCKQGDQFAIVENPPYCFPRYDIYPLAAPTKILNDGFAAAVMDMDGTTTTTEVICTSALAEMVRCMSESAVQGQGIGIDHERDYPHIIGNSTTKHVEYLVNTYQHAFDVAATCRHFLRAVAWTRTVGQDPGRTHEAETALQTQGLDVLLSDGRFNELCAAMHSGASVSNPTLDALVAECANRLRLGSTSDWVRIGIEIYYQQYHAALQAIASGAYAGGNANARRPIEPMPGIGIALALLKGWLGEEAGTLAPLLTEYLHDDDKTRLRMDAHMKRMAALGEYFSRFPVKLALVTSSIAYEADIVLREVFRVIAAEINAWPICAERRAFLVKRFSDPDRVYDARITASNSSEIRLKPHRDLYCLALHALGLGPNAFHRVAGFEDSESGTIAIRAAGIGLCCAIPFAMTQQHQFDAASWVCPGGMPEIILLRNCFLPA